MGDRPFEGNHRNEFWVQEGSIGSLSPDAWWYNALGLSDSTLVPDKHSWSPCRLVVVLRYNPHKEFRECPKSTMDGSQHNMGAIAPRRPTSRS